MTSWDVLSVLGSLFGFILLLVLAWWATRALSRGYAVGSAARTLQVLDRMPLGGEKQLLVVKAGSRVLLLGVTAHHVELLRELGEEELAAPQDGGAPENSPFLGALRRALDAKKGRETADERNSPAQGGE